MEKTPTFRQHREEWGTRKIQGQFGILWVTPAWGLAERDFTFKIENFQIVKQGKNQEKGAGRMPALQGIVTSGEVARLGDMAAERCGIRKEQGTEKGRPKRPILRRDGEVWGTRIGGAFARVADQRNFQLRRLVYI